MLYSKQKAFTLVELIVVVTILAILATIGFVSYSSYLTGVRDTNRIAQMTSLSDGLNLYSTTNELPIPEDNVEVSVNSNLIAYQGYAGANILETINFEKGGVDPKDNTYFSYYLTRDRKYFQLMGFLEESADLTSQNIFSDQANAVNYQDRIPTVAGKKLGILTNLENTPIQDLGSNLDITSSTTGYVARLTNDDTVEDGGLVSINPKSSCLRIRETSGLRKDGEYEINPTGVDGDELKVYCDMTTEGGGWMIASLIADDTTKNMFETGVSETVVSPINNITTKGNISELWTTGEKRDLMIVCETNDEEFIKYEFPFIVYDFQLSDIGNLTKALKAGTTFSSIPLTGKYKNKTLNITGNYATSTATSSVYILGTIDGSASGRLIQFADSDSMYISNTGVIGAPGNTTSGTTSRQKFNQSNYCMTAIR